MPLPGDVNNPEEQQRIAAEQEQQRLAAAEAAERARAQDPTDPGEAWSMSNAAPRLVSGGANAIDDFFSAEQVNGPAGGSWGQSGTPAAAYNAGMYQQGQGAQQTAAAQGAAQQATAQAEQAAAQKAGGLAATNLRGQAGFVGSREAPSTDYRGADRYATKADTARNDANALINRAGQSAQQEQQLQALNNFANQKAGPSAAQAQLAQASDAAQASALSMARSGRGAGDSASALRDAMFSNAQTQATTGQQMAQLRATEEATRREQQLRALDLAMGGAGSIRGADTAAAQLAQGTRAQDLQAQQQAAAQAQFGTQAQQTQTQMNDAAKQGLLNTALGYTQEGNQTGLGYAQLGAQTNLGYQQLGQGAAIDYAQLGQNALDSQAEYELQQQQMALEAQKANQQADLEKDSGISGMIGAAAGVFGLSDERVKDLEQRESALADALETVGNAPGYSYRYKDPSQPGAKSGRQFGPMAQDLERGPLGDTVVVDTPQGKMVDQGRVAMLTASAVTELNHRLKALESSLGRRSHA